MQSFDVVVQFRVGQSAPIRVPLGAQPENDDGVVIDKVLSVFSVPHDPASVFELQKNGFQLVRGLKTECMDFFDHEQVKKVYFEECQRLVKEMIGCSVVLAFDHTIRVEDPVRRGLLNTRAPYPYPHNDFSENGVRQRVIDFFGVEVAKNRRYGSVNLWRPLVSEVQTRPLLCGDGQTFLPTDFEPAERHYLNVEGQVERIGGVYYVQPHLERQKWYFFDKMTSNDVVLLLCFDSNPKQGCVKHTAHGSLPQPNQRPDAIPRESIEVRTLFYF